MTNKKPISIKARYVAAIITSAIILYTLIMTWFYFNPMVNFAIFMPVNPPATLGAKDAAIQTHISVMPIGGLLGAELLLIPPSHTELFANLDGGSLVESKTNGALKCATNCTEEVTPKGQNYIELVDGSGKAYSFIKNGTVITIALWSQQLSRTEIGDYIDSFQAAQNIRFSVRHYSIGP